jgi:hypothetical protein
MPGNITAYEWMQNGTIHIAYTTSDNHIHEIMCRSDDQWRDIDLTRVAGGKVLEQAQVAGYNWPDGHTHQISYVSPVNNDGHIHELIQLLDHPWSYADLMNQPMGAAPSDGLVLSAYHWKTAGTKQVVYTAPDDSIHEIAVGKTGTWKHSNLTRLARAPLAERAVLSAYATEYDHAKHVAYIGGDDHIYELSFRANHWSVTDLTKQTDAPLANGTTLAGFAWESARQQQIIYIGEQNTICELCADQDGNWKTTELMLQTSAPLASGTALAGFVWETDDTKQVVYVGEDHRIHELSQNTQGKWSYSDLMRYSPAPDASDTLLLGHEWSTQFAQHIVYLDRRENPHIHSLLLKHGEQWRHHDLTELTGAQPLV